MDNTFTAKIERYETPGSWHYVPVPAELSVPLEYLAINFGFIAITARVGGTSWQTSLLPGGTKRISLPCPQRCVQRKRCRLAWK